MSLPALLNPLGHRIGLVVNLLAGEGCWWPSGAGGGALPPPQPQCGGEGNELGKDGRKPARGNPNAPPRQEREIKRGGEQLAAERWERKASGERFPVRVMPPSLDCSRCWRRCGPGSSLLPTAACRGLGCILKHPRGQTQSLILHKTPSAGLAYSPSHPLEEQREVGDAGSIGTRSGS